ncbi:MAG: peptidase, partial [Bacteroidota bacterium]
EKLPYHRGMIYAFYLDNRIKDLHEDKSLDDLMRDILDVCHRKGDAKFDHFLFKDFLRKYTNSQEKVYFYLYIERGKLIDFEGKLPKGLALTDHKGIPAFKITDEKELGPFLLR